MSIFSPHIESLVNGILQEARQKKLRLTTAESCTGGLIAGALTTIAGSSDVFDRGFVTYSNDAKMAQLDVSRKTLADFGAVSAEVAVEMAEGALRVSHADISIAVTGIAGPSGATEGKPVGLVYLSLANGKTGQTRVEKKVFNGDRDAVRLLTVEKALALLRQEIDDL